MFTYILPLILSIAFFTLFERKVLAAMQRRRGPMLLVFMVFYRLLLMVLNWFLKKQLFQIWQIL
jgi:NADH:ubiquinone oxidoreductase subunit H